MDDCEMQFSVFEGEGLVDVIGRGHWNGIEPGGNVRSEVKCKVNWNRAKKSEMQLE